MTESDLRRARALLLRTALLIAFWGGILVGLLFGSFSVSAAWLAPLALISCGLIVFGRVR